MKVPATPNVPALKSAVPATATAAKASEQIGRSGFAAEEVHHPFNMNPVSAEANQLKANYYSSKQFFTGGGTVRDWLTGQSFADQYEFGMDVLRRIKQGLPLP